MPTPSSQKTDRIFRGAFWTILVLFAAVTIYVGVRCDFDSHDGFVFLAQSRRLTDPQFATVPFSDLRPRGLVLFLVVFEKAFHFVFSTYPTVAQYHWLSIAIAVATLLVWNGFARRIAGRRWGDAATILLAIHYLYLIQTLYLLSDILTAGVIASTLWLALRLKDQCKVASPRRNLWFYSAALAISGAAIGLSKYQYFFLPPFLYLVLFWAASQLFFVGKEKSEQANRFRHWTVNSAVLYVLAADIGQRIGGDATSGYWYTTLQYVLTEKKLKHGQFPTMPWPSYFVDFYHAYGPIACLLATSISLFFVYQIWNLRKQLAQLARQTEELTLLILVTFLYGAFVQAIPYREPRYILPMLPCFFVLFLVGYAHFTQRLPAKNRPLWFGLCLLSLAHPLWRDWREVTHHEHFCQTRKAENYLPFETYLRQGMPANGCRRIMACQTELDRATYVYLFPDITVDTYFCQGDPASYRDQFTPRIEEKDCLVLGNSFIAENPPNPVKVEKVLAKHVPANEIDRWLGRSVGPGEKVECRKEDASQYTCSVGRFFFGSEFASH